MPNFKSVTCKKKTILSTCLSFFCLRSSRVTASSNHPLCCNAISSISSNGRISSSSFSASNSAARGLEDCAKIALKSNPSKEPNHWACSVPGSTGPVPVIGLPVTYDRIVNDEKSFIFRVGSIIFSGYSKSRLSVQFEPS